MNISTIFNNREIAAFIWLLLLFALGLSIKNIRTAFLKVLREFFKIKILFWIILMLAYASGVTIVLKLIGYWNVALLKNTIQWFLFSGIASAINVVTSSEPNREFKKIVLANLKIIILLEFITNTYTFALWVEFIVLPAVIFIAMLDAVAKSNKRYETVAVITSVIQIIFALVVIYFAGKKAISDYQNLLSIKSLRTIALVPIYALSSVPFLYIFLIVSLYERLFILLKIGRSKNKSVVRYCKRKIFLRLRFSFSRIRSFHKEHGIKLTQIETKNDVDDLFR